MWWESRVIVSALIRIVNGLVCRISRCNILFSSVCVCVFVGTGKYQTINGLMCGSRELFTLSISIFYQIKKEGKRTFASHSCPFSSHLTCTSTLPMAAQPLWTQLCVCGWRVGCRAHPFDVTLQANRLHDAQAYTALLSHHAEYKR